MRKTVLEDDFLLKKIFRRLYSFWGDLSKAVQEDDIIPYAHQLTLSLILAFFPFVMFLFTLVGYFKIDSSLLLDPLKLTLPESVYAFLAGIISEVIDHQHGGLLSLSIILAIYTASGGIRAFMKSSNRITGFQEQRPILLRYVLSIVWVILLAVTLVLALLAVVFGRQLIQVLEKSWPNMSLIPVLNPLRLILPFSFMAIMLTLFFMFGPSLRVPFRYALPGAFFTTIVWVVLTLAFQIYVDQFANYSRFYGTLGALIALLAWLQLLSTVLLLGLEMNAVLMKRHGIDLTDR